MPKVVGLKQRFSQILNLILLICYKITRFICYKIYIFIYHFIMEQVVTYFIFYLVKFRILLILYWFIKIISKKYMSFQNVNFLIGIHYLNQGFSLILKNLLGDYCFFGLFCWLLIFFINDLFVKLQDKLFYKIYTILQGTKAFDFLI